MTLEEFKGLTPEALHDLEFMHEPRRRALSWFQHSPSRLRSLCDILNVEWHPAYEHQQERCRKEIGLKLYNRFTSFCTFIDEAVYRSCKSVGQVLQETVGCLLEDDEIEVVRWTTNPYRQDLLNALTVLRNRQPSIALVRYAQCTQLHQLVNARQAYRLLQSLKKRIYCRKLHLGCLPNGMLVRLRVRSIEENIEQIRNIPELDLAAHFPGQNWLQQVAHDISESESSESSVTPTRLEIRYADGFSDSESPATPATAIQFDIPGMNDISDSESSTEFVRPNQSHPRAMHDVADSEPTSAPLTPTRSSCHNAATPSTAASLHDRRN